MPLALFFNFFCYSESCIRVSIKGNESPESPQCDIKLQLMASPSGDLPLTDQFAFHKSCFQVFENCFIEV